VTDDDGQLELVPSPTPRRPRPPRSAPEPAAQRPVARVVVDSPLAHLDRPFDYLVPGTLDADVVPGCRVRVRFS
jgi:primosomal protein N' (replication factor Y) (superfamily II helicase)